MMTKMQEFIRDSTPVYCDSCGNHIAWKRGEDEIDRYVFCMNCWRSVERMRTRPPLNPPHPQPCVCPACESWKEWGRLWVAGGNKSSEVIMVNDPLYDPWPGEK